MFVWKRNDKHFIAVDGIEGLAYDEIPWHKFSPNSQRLAYAGKRENHWLVVVDGMEGKLYDEILGVFYPSDFLFSPDSKRVGYFARRRSKQFSRARWRRRNRV